MSGPVLTVNGPPGESFQETRKVDSCDIRLAELTASTSPAHIASLRDRILSGFEEYGVGSYFSHPQVCMAIEEALANAIFHGNLELDSRLKEEGPDRFSQLAKDRMRMSPWQDRAVHITELATPFGIWITIRDDGTGFDAAAALRRTVDPETLLASGRGLIMMKAFSDELVFNSVGNEVTLVFYSRRNEDVRDLLKRRAAKRLAEATEHSLL